MSSCGSSQPPFVPVHTAVAGRARVRVAQLKGCRRTACRLEKALAAAPEVRCVEARPLTGTLIVEYSPELGLADIFRIIAAALSALATPPPAERPAAGSVPRSREQPTPSPDDPAYVLERDDVGLHTLSVGEVAARLRSDSLRGLTTADARARFAREGANALPPPQPRSEFAIVLEQLSSLPVALLCASAAISIGTGGLADAVVIMGVVAANAAIGYLTESHAERVIASLEGGRPPPVRVLRDGVTREVSTEEVVRGDLLRLEPGGYVAGDARIVTADGLSVDESSLTGESFPVRKHADPLPKVPLPLADRQNIAFRGTTVTSGSGSALVFTTGAATEVGRVQTLLGTVDPPQTPLQGQLDEMGRRLVLLCGGLCALIFGMGVLRRMAVLPMFKTAVSLAVAALPEGLPAVATSTLALGIARMRRQGVLVRKLPAIETLGAVQTLCFDKTGTLTRNRMSVTAVGLGCGPRYRRGQSPTEILILGEGLLEDAAQALLEVCALCSDASVDGTGNTARIVGSPTEAALLRFALEAGIDVAAYRRARPVVGVQHRTEARPLLATHHNGPENRFRTAVKGNPAAVLERCTTVREGADLMALDPDRRRRILAMNQSMATEGLRVLGFAMAERLDRSSLSDGGLVWLGLVGLSDPIRPGMKELMQVFHRAGIRTVMITGDQSATAYAIARELDLGNGGEIEILDSTHLERLDPRMLEALSARANVFARVSPTHKLAIVQAMQRARRVVAMTGDGVNDGPALRAADVGVAMGRCGYGRRPRHRGHRAGRRPAGHDGDRDRSGSGDLRQHKEGGTLPSGHQPQRDRGDRSRRGARRRAAW